MDRSDVNSCRFISMSVSFDIQDAIRGSTVEVMRQGIHASMSAFYREIFRKVTSLKNDEKVKDSVKNTSGYST